jgi:hypothetical protein
MPCKPVISDGKYTLKCGDSPGVGEMYAAVSGAPGKSLETNPEARTRNLKVGSSFDLSTLILCSSFQQF